ncbi:MAG: hypothetical protein ACK5DV_08710, partial [Planctomycetota bacterium]
LAVCTSNKPGKVWSLPSVWLAYFSSRQNDRPSVDQLCIVAIQNRKVSCALIKCCQVSNTVSSDLAITQSVQSVDAILLFDACHNHAFFQATGDALKHLNAVLKDFDIFCRVKVNGQQKLNEFLNVAADLN